MPNKRPAIEQTGLAGKVRIIAGHWRGRRLPVPDHLGLRPTGDRIRETLFNWLSPLITGTRCLDLFAGSGALGFEAASRGASEVVLVDKEPVVAAHLREQATRLPHGGLVVQCAEARPWLERSIDRHFDIIFLDPPFDYPQLGDLCECLQERGLVKTESRIYVERDWNSPAIAFPANWVISHEKKAGRVRYYLARCE